MIYLTCARPFVLQLLVACIYNSFPRLASPLPYSSSVLSYGYPPSIITSTRPASSPASLLRYYKRLSCLLCSSQTILSHKLLGSAGRGSSERIQLQRDLRALDSMGLEVADISELAALRPIQTAAVSGGLAAGAGADDRDGAAVADTGCVTPTASRERATAWAAEDDGAAAHGIGCATPTAGEPMAAPQRDGGADESIYATPRACRTTAPLDGCELDAVTAAAGDAAVSFTTPTSDESALRPATVCPPAPRKLAPALKRKLAPLQQRLFYPVPRDLATVFKPAPRPPAKKMRPAHAVGSSVPLGT